ncbi:MAG TPA: hypothetical protein VGM92_01805 [Candidatus Kapabacteria bacterium]
MVPTHPPLILPQTGWELNSGRQTNDGGMTILTPPKTASGN